MHTLALASTDMKYVGEPSPHLLRRAFTPFVAPVSPEALSHSRQCPVDRRPLNVSELHPANPIIQSLVSELTIECPYRDVGCPRNKVRRDALNAHLEDDCMHTPTKCPIEGCDTTLPLVEMFEHQDMHRMQFQLETDDNNDAPEVHLDVPTPFDLSEDEDYLVVDINSPTDRRSSLSRLNRNWSVLRRLSRPPSRVPSPPADSSSASRVTRRPLPPLPSLSQESSREPSPAREEYPFLVRATSGYDSTDEHELTIQAGDIIRVTGSRPSGWYEGHHIDAVDDSAGPFLVPRVLTEPFPLDEDDVVGANSSPRRRPESEISEVVTPRPRVPERSFSWGSSPTASGSGWRTRSPPPRPLSVEAPSFSSMYTDDPNLAAEQLVDEEEDYVEEPRYHIPLAPLRLRQLSGPAQLLQRAEDVLYYVQASGNHHASREDDFDFQEGDVMAVTDMAGGDMRGYLLDDARRQDHRGRDRIPSDRVVLFY
ncbi:hypothetical protein DFP72DRAFT_841223 [Ephemerocybe angulata]|uniref:SH3 domain-containing protein n=1 Tax=Ephemerocybe angulata TaxID=980116 RepID=A0A8H6IEZ4_9AGAR|nr:hypothetical protein DFP72DRAFT_841223 [Tulosesus angulatus]